jgi:hypothetical protein
MAQIALLTSLHRRKSASLNNRIHALTSNVQISASPKTKSGHPGRCPLDLLARICCFTALLPPGSIREDRRPLHADCIESLRIKSQDLQDGRSHLSRFHKAAGYRLLLRPPRATSMFDETLSIQSLAASLSLPNSRCPFFSTTCCLFSQKPGDVGLLTASDLARRKARRSACYTNRLR